MENSFRSLIDQAKSILILLPTKPFFDQVAAALSLYLSLRDEKDIQVSSPTSMTVEFNRLIGVNRISQEMGNKNMVIRFVDYPASDIERVSYDIEDGQFRLSVIPKTRLSPPSKEQVQLSYSGVSSDTVIIIGGANESHFPALSLKELTSAKIIHIGIRDISLSSGKGYISFSRPASSVSEVIAGLIKESGMSINQDIATNLLMGIEEASNNYTDPNVGAETFAIVSELMQAGGKRISSQGVAQRQNYPAGAIPTMSSQSQMYGQGQEEPKQKLEEQTQGPLQNQYSDLAQVQPSPQPQPQGDNQAEQNQETGKISEEDAPEEWLSAPKIYKGGSSINSSKDTSVG